MTAFRLTATLAFAMLPVVAQAAPAEVRATVNLRMGPGPGYQAFVTLPAGTPVEVYECLPQGGWCDVSYGNVRGWVAGRMLVTYGRTARARPVPPPPMFSPPPIYAEPPVYANPRPIYREPQPDYSWGPGPVDPGYIEPPAGYAYRPPVVVAPPIPVPVEVYPTRPPAPALRQATRPPQVASTPPVTQPSAAAAPIVTQQANPPATVPTTPSTSPSVPKSQATPSVASATPAAPAPANTAKPKYGSAVGTPGAPCKWVNGICRND